MPKKPNSRTQHHLSQRQATIPTKATSVSELENFQQHRHEPVKITKSWNTPIVSDPYLYHDERLNHHGFFEARVLIFGTWAIGCIGSRDGIRRRRKSSAKMKFPEKFQPIPSRRHSLSV
ncbi:hypothetical protein VTJ04DRAFT_1908 [Mycothermus thermophilus]|uniref:uncharacterized protein n=1 Tax=Humicola insolens TaxID=85995 RepID=UPI0037434941